MVSGSFARTGFYYLQFAFLLSDDPAAAHIEKRPVNGRVAEAHTFQLAKQWVEDCHVNHTRCAEVKRSFQPSRVLDVGSEADSHIRLVETKAYPSTDFTKFVALSYCWGGDQAVKSTKATLASRLAGVSFIDLPITLQDSVTVCRKLAIQYLWIDCLCIIQDDPDDLIRELATMGRVYRESYLTLKASSASRSQDGFLEDRNSQKDENLGIQARFVCQDGSIGSVILLREDKMVPPWPMQPLDSRGWALQEHELSPRILEYGIHQARWLCQTVDLFDGGLHRSAGKAEEVSIKGGYLAASIYEDTIWSSVVQDYCNRALSFDTDKLPAVAAIAEEYYKNIIYDDRGNRITQKYLAGLWLFSLSSLLLWTRSGEATRPTDYRAPSWSWAALNSKISFDNCSIEEATELEILEAETTPASDKLPFGAVTSGHVKLKSRMLRSPWKFTIQEVESSAIPSDAIGGQLRIWLDAPNEDFGNTFDSSQLWFFEATCSLRCERQRGLILVEFGNSTYRRVGAFSINHHQPDSLDIDTLRKLSVGKHSDHCQGCFAQAQTHIITVI